MKIAKEQINAFLGKDTEFEGKLSFSGTVRVDGAFRGEITDGGTLIVGETAHVHSDIHASHIIIRGEVHGNIFGSTKIEMCSPGKIYGNIKAPAITIEQGVTFEGNCRMRSGEKDVEKKIATIP